MFGTYKKDDVTLLLKNITGQVEPLGTAERERRIQSGVHYSEMLPIEYAPSSLYLKTYEDALERYAYMTAQAVATVAEKIWKQKGNNVVLVSLARAGISIGVLIKRYIRLKYGAEIMHYAISIIRGRGIDHNAMKYILNRHNASDIQFVDGWTGKGAIQRELDKAMLDYPGVSSGLAVLSDPAGLAEKYGTRDDFLIVSSCLNSTISGLLSRTFYRSDVIGQKEFHGAVYYQELMEEDRTYEFIQGVECFFDEVEVISDSISEKNFLTAAEEVSQICEEFSVSDVNLCKPSIGEATRVLLRRMPWKILVHSMHDDDHLGHIYQLAKEKNVPLLEYPLINYRACGLIQSVADM